MSVESTPISPHTNRQNSSPFTIPNSTKGSIVEYDWENKYAIPNFGDMKDEEFHIMMSSVDSDGVSLFADPVYEFGFQDKWFPDGPDCIDEMRNNMIDNCCLEGSSKNHGVQDNGLSIQSAQDRLSWKEDLSLDKSKLTQANVDSMHTTGHCKQEELEPELMNRFTDEYWNEVSDTIGGSNDFESRIKEGLRAPYTSQTNSISNFKCTVESVDLNDMAKQEKEKEQCLMITEETQSNIIDIDEWVTDDDSDNDDYYDAIDYDIDYENDDEFYDARDYVALDTYDSDERQYGKSFKSSNHHYSPTEQNNSDYQRSSNKFPTHCSFPEMQETDDLEKIGTTSTHAASSKYFDMSVYTDDLNNENGIREYSDDDSDQEVFLHQRDDEHLKDQSIWSILTDTLYYVDGKNVDDDIGALGLTASTAKQK